MSNSRKRVVISDHAADANASASFVVEAIVILVMITLSNTRLGVPLHKLNLIEVGQIGLWHATSIFSEPIYGWFLSSNAIFLYLPYNLHNVIAWIKNKPFLPEWGSNLYIGTIMPVFLYWIAEMYLNFQYNNGLGNIHSQQTSPWEALARDPWWIFTSDNLINIIKREYGLGVAELVRASPRFGNLTHITFPSLYTCGCRGHTEK